MARSPGCRSDLPPRWRSGSDRARGSRRGAAPPPRGPRCARRLDGAGEGRAVAGEVLPHREPLVQREHRDPLTGWQVPRGELERGLASQLASALAESIEHEGDERDRRSGSGVADAASSGARGGLPFHQPERRTSRAVPSSSTVTSSCRRSRAGGRGCRARQCRAGRPRHRCGTPAATRSTVAPARSTARCQGARPMLPARACECDVVSLRHGHGWRRATRGFGCHPRAAWRWARRRRAVGLDLLVQRVDDRRAPGRPSSRRCSR